MMKNRDIYRNDPSTQKLVNEGVASVNDDATQQSLQVLKYELETFVCDGQYDKGLEHILYTYLKNVDQAQQPAVWVSGFYGSGKSHLVKMLRALWVDTKFEDGSTARGLVNLPTSIVDHLKELSNQGKRHGGIHAASGTLGASARGSVRLALLSIVFKSIGLPEDYAKARFVMWLRNEGIYDQIHDLVEKGGSNWQEELDNFYVAEGLHKALVQCKPNLFSSTATCVETLNNLYPFVQDVSSDEMIKTIREALKPPGKDGKFPLTLIALDEVQQYIGEDSQRSMDVQETVESCCKGIGGKLLFIGTGQTAVTWTTNLKRLEGRFTVRVELSDSDVDSVVRTVILGKKAAAIPPIDQVIQTNLGEISRHLSGTTIGHRQEDSRYFTQDYPVLPVRRRFWESTLRVLDPTGTDSQLRNQLSMVHRAIQTNLDESLGHVIPGDYLYFDSADKLLQSRILPRTVHEKTMLWIKGSENERLTARACGLVFLINKLAGDNNEVGIKATVDTIADLMVEDLSTGSASLRSKLPGLLDTCELLIKVKDVYRIQTKESTAWNDDFNNECSRLANQQHFIDSERDDRIRQKFAEIKKGISLTQGDSKVSREINMVFDRQLPAGSERLICVWMRDGWSIDENSVRADARQAGNQSSTIFVFIPKRNADDLRHYLIDQKAATVTLDIRGIPDNPEGKEAREAIETIKQTAETKIKELLDEAFSGARIFQGGGTEIIGNNLQEMVAEACKNALQRLYPQFQVADHAGWDKVYSQAKQGAPDALKAVGDEGEAGRNAVCKAILSSLGAGKTGTDIRLQLESPPYGWSRDAVDGGIQVLLVAGLIRAQDERGQVLDAKALDRKAIGKTSLKIEATTVTTTQRVKIRWLFQKLGFQCKHGEELSVVPQFLQKLLELADRAGGEPPMPAPPDTASINEIRRLSGNEQLVALFNQKDELSEAIDKWESLANEIQKRWPYWQELNGLLNHAGEIKEAEEARQQCQSLESQRLLLAEPNPIVPLTKSLEEALRHKLTLCHQHYQTAVERQVNNLESDSAWQQLTNDEQNNLLDQFDIKKNGDLTIGTRKELIETLDKHPIGGWSDKIDAVGTRFAHIRERVAKSIEPETQTVDLPRRTLRSENDVDAWIQDVHKQLKTAISKGPIVIR